MFPLQYLQGVNAVRSFIALNPLRQFGYSVKAQTQYAQRQYEQNPTRHHPGEEAFPIF